MELSVIAIFVCLQLMNVDLTNVFESASFIFKDSIHIPRINVKCLCMRT